MCTFCVAVVLERITEGVLQRLEPGSEIPPLIESLTIDGLANLLRAGSAHAALRLVEHQALGFEVELAEIKHAPHAALQIIDDVLVMYAQNGSGKRTIPMPHQLKVGPIVTRDIVDAVGELLTVGK